MAVWFGYRGKSDNLNWPPPNPCGASGVCGALGAYYRDSSTCCASKGDTCLQQEDGVEEDNATTTTELEIIGVCEARDLSLRTDACCVTLLFLNLSCLSTMMPKSKPHQHYTYETQRVQAKKYRQINFRDVSPDSGKQSVGKFLRCVSVRLCNS